MITRLHARGFVGIKRGTGQDEIDIDFTGRTGMIALDGKNGGGKTSTLDLLHPFDTLASRAGSLSNHVMLRDSMKELEFTHAGHSYRTLLKIDSQSGKSEGFAYIDGSTASVTNGKISEYKKWALSTFGSPELFFSSLFCAQNSPKISDMRVGELKALFVEFLRIERYAVWSETSKQAGNILQAKMTDLENRITALMGTIDSVEATRFNIQTAETKLKEAEESLSGIKGLNIINHDIADRLKETIAQNTAALSRRADLQRNIDRMNVDMAREKAAVQVEIDALTAKYRAAGVDLKTAEAILAARGKIEGAAEQERQTRERIEAAQQEADRLTREIENGRERVPALELSLQEAKQALRELDNDQEIAELARWVERDEQVVKDLTRKASDFEHDRETTKILMAIDNALEKTTALEKKDPACASVTCSFIVGALEAEKSVLELQAQLADRKRVVAAAVEEINKKIKYTDGVLQQKKADHARFIQEQATKKTETATKIRALNHDLRNAQQVALSFTELLDVTRRKLSTDKTALESLKTLTARVPEIQTAEIRKAELEKRLAEVTEEGLKKREGWIVREKFILSVIDGEREKLAAIVIDNDAEGKLKTVLQEIRTIETERIPAVDREIQAARDSIAALQAELARIEAAEKEMLEVRRQKEELAAQVSRWRYLQNVCGKNGIQALEIDGAAPLISARANELLMRGYGPQFTVRIDTQDEEGREDLDIKVLSDHGVDSLKDKSGGEKIWLLHPIRLAMALLSKEKSGRDWDMAFMDEIDGPLDREGAATNFMEMYRPFMDMGGIRQLFFITHREACLSYADHVLRFQAGKHPQWG